MRTDLTSVSFSFQISGIDMNKVVEMLYKHEQQLSTLATDDLAVTEDSTTVSTGSSSDINSRENNYENVSINYNDTPRVLGCISDFVRMRSREALHVKICSSYRTLKEFTYFFYATLCHTLH